VTIKVMLHGDARVEDYATNWFTKWYEKLTNVHVEWQVTSGSPQEAQQALSLTVASGSLPDAMMYFGSDPTALAYYGGQGTFIPLNSLIDKYGLGAQQLFKEQPVVRDLITSADGNIYGLPQVNICYHCSMVQKMWIDQTWLDKLGLKMPQTTEEFRTVLQAFKDKDPNGNGKTGAAPLTGAAKSWQMDLRGYLINPFILEDTLSTNQHLLLRDGKVMANFVAPEYKDALKYIKSLFDQGLIGSEALTQADTDVRQVVEGPHNQYGAILGGYMGLFSEVGGKSRRWLEYVTVPPLKGPSGNRVTPIDRFGVNGGQFMITSAAKNPDLIMRWADGFYQSEIRLRSGNGPRGTGWEYAAAGQTGIDGSPACVVSLKNYDAVQNDMWYDTGIFYQSSASRLCLAAVGSNGKLESVLYNQTHDNYAPYAAPASMIVPPLFPDTKAAAEMSTLWTGINNYGDQAFGEFVTGKTDIDTGWDAYIANINKLGLPRYLELKQAAFDAKWKGKWSPKS